MVAFASGVVCVFGMGRRSVFRPTPFNYFFVTVTLDGSCYRFASSL